MPLSIALVLTFRFRVNFLLVDRTINMEQVSVENVSLP